MESVEFPEADFKKPIVQFLILAPFHASATRMQLYRRCLQTERSKTSFAGYFAESTSSQSSLALKKARTPLLQAQYKLLFASFPLPIFFGTGIIPWLSLSQSATKTWIMRRLSEFLAAVICFPFVFPG